MAVCYSEVLMSSLTGSGFVRNMVLVKVRDEKQKDERINISIQEEARNNERDDA
jgi:hypothetical protein